MAQPPATTDKPKLRPVSKKTRTAIEALLTGQAKTQMGAAQIAGMDNTALCRALQRPNAKALIEQMVRERLSSHGMLRASALLESLMDSATSEYVQADVAKHVLAVNGVRPTQDKPSGGNHGIMLRLVINQPSDAVTIEHDPDAIITD